MTDPTPVLTDAELAEIEARAVRDGDTTISWNFGSTFISGTHKACRMDVVSIWEDATP